MNFFGHELWHPFARWGITHPFFTIHADTIINTWITLGIIIVTCVISNYLLKKHQSLGPFVMRTIGFTLYDMLAQNLQKVPRKYFSFIGTLFLFILVANCIVLIPGCEEATKDINTTFALSLSAFLYIQKEAILSHGLLAYVQEFFQTPLPLMIPSLPIIIRYPAALVAGIINTIIGIATLPLELLSKFSLAISLSFRLFGNIFAGAVIHSLIIFASGTSLLRHVLFTVTGINFIVAGFFGLFEGIMQAFIFVTLTLTFIGIAIAHQEQELTT